MDAAIILARTGHGVATKEAEIMAIWFSLISSIDLFRMDNFCFHSMGFVEFVLIILPGEARSRHHVTFYLTGTHAHTRFQTGTCVNLKLSSAIGLSAFRWITLTNQQVAFIGHKNWRSMLKHCFYKRLVYYCRRNQNRLNTTITTSNTCPKVIPRKKF
jgi:hypothetical protein